VKRRSAFIFFASMFASMVSGVAGAKPYQITLYGYDLSELNQVKNCIDYSVCTEVSSQIERSYTSPSFMEIKADFSDSERDQVLLQCLASRQYQLKIQVTEQGSSQPVALPLSSSGKPFPLPYPVELTAKSADENYRIKNEIEEFIARKKYDRALREVTERYRIPFADYQVSVNSDQINPKLSYAITDHKLKTVVVDKGFLSDACHSVLGLRHEAEHILQVARYRECRAQGKTSAFQYQAYRERSAYLNDIWNLKNYCVDYQTRTHEQKYRYDVVFEKYGNGAALVNDLD
jgi:hypothetical protein